MADNRLPNIDKLNSSNWPVWKMQLTNYLISRELWDMCDGTEAAPVRNVDETLADFGVRQKQYTINKARAINKARVMSILGQTISTSFLYLIASHEVTTPQQAWNALIGHFERPSLSNKMALRCQLFGLKMDPTISMDSHLKELNQLVERLAALNAPIEEQVQVALLLRSLPPTYESIYTAYVAKGEVSMGELREALINHEQHLTNDSGGDASGSNESALASRSRYQPVVSSRVSREPREPTCYECGETGHYARQCPRLQRAYGRHGGRVTKVESGNYSDDDVTGAF